VALGKSAMAVFGILASIERARGHGFQHSDIPLLVTYHPQFVAYRGGEGGAVWQAMVRDLARAWRAGDPQAQ
jgi:hypothetical protein